MSRNNRNGLDLLTCPISHWIHVGFKHELFITVTQVGIHKKDIYSTSVVLAVFVNFTFQAVLWRYKFSQLKGSSDDGKSKIKFLFQNQDSKSIEAKVNAARGRSILLQENEHPQMT